MKKLILFFLILFLLLQNCIENVSIGLKKPTLGNCGSESNDIGIDPRQTLLFGLIVSKDPNRTEEERKEFEGLTLLYSAYCFSDASKGPE
jgi:hypothetical protein